MATDPNNAEVLLSLGVSYTNELDQGRALNFLTAWLSRQPAFTKVLLRALRLSLLPCERPVASSASCALSMPGVAHSLALLALRQSSRQSLPSELIPPGHVMIPRTCTALQCRSLHLPLALHIQREKSGHVDSLNT